jgi:hypothetical protein
MPTYLHDGRARSVEEAILWHAGEAEAARQRFEHLPVHKDGNCCFGLTRSERANQCLRLASDILYFVLQS